VLYAILLACLVSAPYDCREHELRLEAVMPTAAWVEANYRAAGWILEHPGWEKRTLVVVVGRGV
jgi:hypothetical protein